MKLTEQKLINIILEEIENIENEDLLKELYLEKFAEHGIEQVLLEERDWFPIATTGVAIGLLGALMNMHMTNSAELRAKWAATAAKSDAKLASRETKNSEMLNQLKNMTAWSWTDDADPRSKEAFPSIRFEEVPDKAFTVMPPEYAVFLQVAKDKQKGIFRYGVPDSVEDVEEIENAITTADAEVDTDRRQNRISFIKDFDDISLYDTLKSETGIYGVGGQIYLDQDNNPVQMQAIVPDFEMLEDYYGGPLPLTGVTVKELYNNFMFGNYFSTEEAEMVQDYLELEIDTELNPELIDRTNKRAEQDVAALRAKRNEEKNA